MGNKRKAVDDAPEEVEHVVSSTTLDRDVLYEIARNLEKNSLHTLMRFRSVDETCKKIGNKILSRKESKIVDANQIYSNDNPLHMRFFDPDEKKAVVSFHTDVRRLVTYLEKLGLSTQEGDLALENFTEKSVRWIFEGNEKDIKHCPALLQKRIKKLYKHSFKNSSNFTYSRSLLRPTRFFSLFSKSPENVTYLDLGYIKEAPYLNLRENVFPTLVSLKHFFWQKAEMWFVEALPAPHNLKTVSLQFTKGHFSTEALQPILNCQNLKFLSLGYKVPPHATRFDLEVLMNTYSNFFNNRQYSPSAMFKIEGFDPVPLSDEQTEKDYAIRAFPKMKHMCFWHCPSNLFVLMDQSSISYKTLQFGQLDQSLSRLCNIDSVVQALFTYIPTYQCNTLRVKHLKLNLHAMPVVTLDYYLPQLLNQAGEAFPFLKSMDLFIKCTFDACMGTSWLLEGKRVKNYKSKLQNLTHFSFHIDGFCLLDDLDTHFPPSLQCLNLSFVVPPKKRNVFLNSLCNFIKNLDDPNRFPDLEELHVQIYGIRCFEKVINQIIDIVPDLKKISVLCMPVGQDRNLLIDLIGHAINSCKKLTTLGLCPDMLKFILEKDYLKKPKDLLSWRLDFDALLKQQKFSRNCDLECLRLPICSDYDSYVVKPTYPDVNDLEEEQDDDDIADQSTESDSRTDDEGEFSDEEDSFVVNDDDEEEESEDELDELERKLENENSRCHRRDERRRRIISEGSSGAEQEGGIVVFRGKSKKGDGDDDDEGDDWDVDEDEEEEEGNSFLDDMAEEKSNDEESAGDETEPEMEEPESDTPDYTRNAIEIVNARRRMPPPKKRRIIESDSD